jgi:hypothetical protein
MAKNNKIDFLEIPNPVIEAEALEVWIHPSAMTIKNELAKSSASSEDIKNALLNLKFNWRSIRRANNLIPIACNKSDRAMGSASFHLLDGNRINDNFKETEIPTPDTLIIITSGTSTIERNIPDDPSGAKETVLDEDAILWWGFVENINYAWGHYIDNEGNPTVAYKGTVSANEIGHFFERTKIAYALTCRSLSEDSDTTDVDYYTIEIPSFNYKRESEVIGNMVKYNLGTGLTEAGVFYYNDTITDVNSGVFNNPEKWWKAKVIEHLFKISIKVAHPMLPLFTFNANTSYNDRVNDDAINDVWDFSNASYMQALNTLFPAEDWWFINFDLKEAGIECSFINGNDLTGTDIQINDRIDVFSTVDVPIYDTIELVGDYHYWTATLPFNLRDKDAIKQPSVIPNWTDTQEAAYEAAYDDDEETPNDNKYDTVFREYILNTTSSAGLLKTGVAASTYSNVGEYETDGAPAWQLNTVVCPKIVVVAGTAKINNSYSDLPHQYCQCIQNSVFIEGGRDLSTGALPNDQKSGSDFKDILLFYNNKDNELEFINETDDPDLAGCQIKPLDYAAGIRIQFKEQPTLALNHANTGEEILDYNNLACTCTIRSERRMRFIYNNILGLLGTQCKETGISKLTVVDEEYKFNAILYGTILGINENKDPEEFLRWSAPGNIVDTGDSTTSWHCTRNDYAKMYKKFNEMITVYTTLRRVATISTPDIITAYPLGTLIENAVLNFGDNTGNNTKGVAVRTIVSNISYDLERGITTLTTTHNPSKSISARIFKKYDNKTNKYDVDWKGQTAKKTAPPLYNYNGRLDNKKTAADSMESLIDRSGYKPL